MLLTAFFLNKPFLCFYSASEPYPEKYISRISAVLHLPALHASLFFIPVTGRCPFTIFLRRQSNFIIHSTSVLNCHRGLGKNEYCVLVFKNWADNPWNYRIICDIRHMTILGQLTWKTKTCNIQSHKGKVDNIKTAWTVRDEWHGNPLTWHCHSHCWLETMQSGQPSCQIWFPPNVLM